MPPRIPSATSQAAAERARAEGRARQMCGEGPLTDVVDAGLLKAELSQFYAKQEGTEGPPPGRIALNRTKQALDYIFVAAEGARRITKAITRALWALLLVEMVRKHILSARIAIYREQKFARKLNDVSLVRPLEAFIQTITSGARRDNSWDIGKVRHLLARGWPEDQPVRKLKSIELGPLHWWRAINELELKKPFLRQNIYDAARTLATPLSPTRPPRAPSTSRSASASSRPAREAAGTTNAALRGTVILDDDQGGTYNPEDADRQDAPTQARPWRFGDNTSAEFTVRVSSPAARTAPSPPPPQPPPPGSSRRAQPSPWLAPSGFTADLKWNILDYNAHKEMLKKWPRNQHAPDSAVWEHPNSHGLRVLADGLPKTFQVRPLLHLDLETAAVNSHSHSHQTPCANCRKRFYICIPHGSKACLPCYWEKGSQGKCEGGVPPEGPVEKPDFKIRVAFFKELDAAGVYPFPHHYVHEDGRARHGPGAGGVGKPPGYAPAPRYSPPRPEDAATNDIQDRAPPVSTPTAPAQDAPSSLGDPISHAPDTQGPAPLSDPPPAATPATVPKVAAQEAPEVANEMQDAAPQAPAGAGIGNGSDGNVVRKDVAMTDVESAPKGKRKRHHASTAGENELPPPRSDAAAAEAAPPRKRKRRDAAHAVPKAVSGADNAGATNSRRSDALLAGAAASTERPVSAIPSNSENLQETVYNSSQSRSQSATASPPLSPATADGLNASLPGPVDKAKGKVLDRSRPTGQQQRSSRAESQVQFHSPVPRTRSVPRESSLRFPSHPWPVIPDRNMQVDGDRARETPGGVSGISYPHAPPPMSTLNLSGDIFLANHVERALCHELRDVSNHHRDWILGRHREIMQALRELQTVVQAQGLGYPAPNSTVGHRGPGTAVFVNSSNAPPAIAASQGGQRRQDADHNLTDGARLHTVGLSEDRLKGILASSLAPFHDMAGNVQDLTRHFAELEPIAGRVNEMSGRVDSISGHVAAMGTDMQSLVARVQRLEDVGPLARNLRVFNEHQDRMGEAPAPILILR
ncbi:unnamed protein product [Peniophora sp. CBMAI 1063]|nr:unnamed protein product [Peniophora sp. CBMAI 1063]